MGLKKGLDGEKVPVFVSGEGVAPVEPADRINIHVFLKKIEKDHQIQK